MYQEINPTSELRKLIDSFWIFSGNEMYESFKILPDTCTDLIFDLNQNQGFLSGTMTKFQLCELASQTNLIGVRFKTENFGSLSKTPLREIKNLRVELSEIFSSSATNKLAQITDLETLADQLKFLENFVAAAFTKNQQRQDKMVIAVAENIRTLKGKTNMVDLAKSNHISLRQLERRFKSYIGLTVKEFSSIVRFNTAKDAIKTSNRTSLLQIAFDTGFFDHSHMNNEFNRISGENPSFFR